MTLETFLFLAVALLAIASAASMLLTENAVHSALFLIVVMACIAFLFLMLEAPFLAMVQIAVYAGAIMVLFLFVIMLLGAEKAEVIEPQNARRFRWQPVLALIFAASFFGLAALAILQGKIDFQVPTNQPATLRFANFASGPAPLDVYVNGEQILASPSFSTITDFISVPVGTVTVSLVPAGRAANASFRHIDVDVTPGSVNTVVAYGTDNPSTALGVVSEDWSNVPAHSARITVFNAYNTDIELAQINSALFNDGSRNVQALTTAVPVGTASSAEIIDEGTADWTIIGAGDEAVITGASWNGRDGIITRVNDLQVARGTSQVLIVTVEKLDGDASRIITLPLVSRTDPAFGSPQAIGYTLFTTYMLPFQMIAMLLLVAMIGAVVLTHKQPAVAARRRDVRRVVSRPLTTVITAQTGTDVTKTAEEPTTQPSGD